MRGLRAWLVRFFGLFNAQSKDRDLEEEVESHLCMLVDEYVRRGMPPGEARRQALLEFGGLDSVKEAYRDRRGLPGLEALWQDTHYGARMLRRNPGFALVAVATLGLGIGANTAIFSLVNALLLRALPYPHPEELMVIWSDNPGLLPGMSSMPPANADIAAWRGDSQSFVRVAAFAPGTADLADAENPERIGATRVTAGFFETLGVSPVAGRTFSWDEERSSQPTVAMIGHGLWERRFGRDPAVVGKTMTVNGEPLTVIGILPPHFDFPRASEWPSFFPFPGQTEIWLPLTFRLQDWQNRDERGLVTIGRLKRDHSTAQAQAELAAFGATQAKLHPETHQGWRLTVIPLRAQLIGKSQTAILILFCSVGLLLLIACVNVANLLLARAAARQKELAVRCAMGATRFRLLRQLLTESLLISGLGCAFGLLAGFACLQIFQQFDPMRYSRLNDASIDFSVLLFTGLTAVGTSVAFGLVPALLGTKLNLRDSIQSDGRSGGSIRLQVRGWLVGSQVAIAIVLLMGAGLMVRSFLRLQAVNPGFRPNSVLTFEVQLPNGRYGQDIQQVTFFEQLVSRLQILPGVQAAGAISSLPLSGGENQGGFTIEGAPPVRSGDEPVTERRWVTPGYFTAMGIPVRSGRTITANDGPGQPRVVVINESLARQSFPGQSPIGRRLRVAPSDAGAWRSIVGVVSDVRSRSLESKPGPQIYLPHAQGPWASMTVAIRTQGAAAAFASTARSALRALDPALPAAQMRTMEQIVSTATQTRSFNMSLLVLFAGSALFLTAVGIYGVVSYLVSRQQRDIGIRLALGASRGDVLGLVLRQGMKPVGLGSIVGVLSSLATCRLIASQLYSVSASDPLTLAVIVALLFVVSLLACGVPARRAALGDPMTALRKD